MPKQAREARGGNDAAQRLRLFDVHRHIVPDSGDEEVFRVPERADFKAWIEAWRGGSPQEAEGVACALMPPAFYNLTNGIEDTRRLNDLVHAVCRARGASAAVAIGIVEPLHGEVALAEIDRAASELGMVGLVWRHRAQGIFVDAPIMQRLVERAAERRLVPMLHASPRSGNEALWRIWGLAERFPQVPMIVLGALTTWDDQQTIIGCGDRARNVHYDTAGFFGEPRQLGTLAERLGPHRLVFGSGAHCTAEDDVAGRAQEIAESDLPDALKRAILVENARTLLRREADR
jgi:predicted TIM-barrel fold metal-dependent hydrolase